MKTHIANRTKNTLYNLYLIKNIRRYITQDTAKWSYVHWYSHNWTTFSVLMDLRKATLRPYNYTERYTARLTCNKTKRDSAQDCMKFLHRLPTEFSTKFKLMAIVFKTLQGNGPDYLKVKVLLLYSAAQLNQMVSVVLYNLTPGRGITQPWCEPSPWGDQSRWAAYISCRASAKCLSSQCCQSRFYTLVRWGTHGVHILPKDVTAQLGLVTYHTMEQCQQDGHPSMY